MTSPMLGLRTTIYLVPDLEKATDWYAKAFQAKPYFVEPFYVGFNIGGFELGLFPEGHEPIGEKRTNGVEAYWGVKDIEKEHQRMIEVGATQHTPPNNVGGDIVVSTVLDPWNNVIGLIYNPHFKLD